MASVGWVISDHGYVPLFWDDEGKPIKEALCLRVGLNLSNTGLAQCGKSSPAPIDVQSYWVVAPDRDALKREVCKRIDWLFELLQRNQELESAIDRVMEETSDVGNS